MPPCMAFFVCVIFVSAFAVVILHDVTSKRERENVNYGRGVPSAP